MKRILSLLVASAMLISLCAVPVSAAPSLKAESKFTQILDNLASGEFENIWSVYFRDINVDGTEEMFVVYLDKSSHLNFNVYSATPSGTSVYNVYKDVLYSYSGGFLFETATAYADGASVIIKLETNSNDLNMSDDVVLPTIVTYHKLTVNKDYNIVASKDSYYSSHGQAYNGDDYVDVRVATDAEKKAFAGKYEKGKGDVFYSMGRNDGAYYKDIYGMSYDEAKQYIKKGISKVEKPDYSGFDDKTGSISDSDKLKIQNLIHRIEIKDEPTNIASMNEQQIIDMTSSYTLRRDPDTKYVDSMWLGGGGNNFYKSTEAERHIYNTTGIMIDLKNHRCTDQYCGADYDDEYLRQIYFGDKKDTIADEVKKHNYFVSGSNEGDRYQFPVIKNIYYLDSSTFLVIFDCAVYDSMGYPYDHDKLYKNADNIDYGECYLSEKFSSYAIVGVRKQGKNNSYYMIEQGGKSLITAEQAKKYIKVSSDDTNITPDYKKASGFKTASEFVDYLRSLIDGKQPNDSAKNEIVKYAEYAIEQISRCTVKAKSNKVTVNADTVASVIAKAKQLKDDFEDLVNETGFDLNKDIDLCIRADVDGAKLSKGITVELDKSLTEWTDIVDKIKIVLDDDNHSITADSDAIEKMISAGVRSVSVKRDKNKYTITYIDSDGKAVGTCPAKLTFAFCSDSEYNVVYYERDGKKENWSGQYNSADGTIEFMTSFSGVYYVEENELEISDISDLTDEQQQAVRFMVSRGYFTLTDGKFNPYGLLSRNDFTKALVSIFYELDYEAKTTFADVADDDAYYSYIASSQYAEIVKGFEDNTFRGTNNTTKEEVVSIASRTIAEKKGYTYPENADDYISFADADDITYWEGQKGEIALAVREGLIDKGGSLAPKADITRVEAALILYRLFNILYEVTPAAAEGGSFPVIPVAAGSAAVVIGGGAAAFFIIRKRKF